MSDGDALRHVRDALLGGQEDASPAAGADDEDVVDDDEDYDDEDEEEEEDEEDEEEEEAAGDAAEDPEAAQPEGEEQDGAQGQSPEKEPLAEGASPDAENAVEGEPGSAGASQMEDIDPEAEYDTTKDIHDLTTPSPSRQVRLPPSECLETGGLLWMFVKTGLASWLSMDGATGCFRASTQLRLALSSYILVQIVPVITLTGAAAQDPETQRRILKVKRRMPQSQVYSTTPRRLYIFFAFREKPLKLGTAIRRLQDLIPMVAWPEAKLSFKCRGNADAFEIKLRRSIGAIAHLDMNLFLENPYMMRKVTQVTLNTAEVLHLEDNATFPQVLFVKIICYETDSAPEVVHKVFRGFANMTRLHLVIVPAALHVISGPGFVAPRDFRLSLTKASIMEQDENIFVTSHLFSLPFSWSGDAFRNVVRLQLMQLHQESFGKSLESLIVLLQTLPNLRRLGTMSLRAVELFDILRDDCKLEELVTLVEVIDTYKLFTLLQPLELWKRRTGIRRLAVHFLCIDGVPRLPVDVETAYCAGWLSMANLLQKGGHIAFSVGHPQLQETALLQLPWLLPGQFSFDPAIYRWPDRLPLSTPLERELPGYGLEGVKQPSGILVRGRAKARNREDVEAAAIPAALPTGNKLNLSLNLSGLRPLKEAGAGLSIGAGNSQLLSTPFDAHAPSGRFSSSFKKGSMQAAHLADVWVHPAEEWREMSLKEAVDIMRAHAAY